MVVVVVVEVAGTLIMMCHLVAEGVQCRCYLITAGFPQWRCLHLIKCSETCHCKRGVYSLSYYLIVYQRQVKTCVLTWVIIVLYLCLVEEMLTAQLSHQ